MANVSIRREAEKPNDVSILGEKVHLPFSGKVAKNRFMKAAMTEYQSSWDQNDLSKRGIPSEGLIKVYEQWGKGGFGIILSGNVVIDEMNLEGAGNAIIHKRVAHQPERKQAFQRLAKGAKQEGSLFITQLSHAGRQVADTINPNPVSASDIKLDDRMGHSFAKPTALTKTGIQEIIQDFAFAAKYVYENGGDGVQLHAAHGYLLAQFLAQSTNKRTDHYGGSLENRARIIYEIIEEIKKEVNDPSFILAIKINSVEFQSGGFTPEECKQVCEQLELLGVDVIELSGGTYEELKFYHQRESTRKREAFFLEFSEIIRKGVQRSKIYTTGGFRTSKGMIEAIQSGSTDGIGLGRPVTQEFDLPKKLIDGTATSASKILLNEDDFMITNVASGTQMQQIANQFEPFDQAKEQDVEQFNQTVQQWMEEQSEKGKKGIIEAGFPTLQGQPLKSL